MSRPHLRRIVAVAATVVATASSWAALAAPAAGPADVLTAAVPSAAATVPSQPETARDAAAPVDEAELAGDVVARTVEPVTSRRGLDPDTCPVGFVHEAAIGCIREVEHGIAELATPDGDDVTVATPHHHHGQEPDVEAAAGSDWYLSEVARRPVACAPAHTPRTVAVYVHKPGKNRLSSVVGTIRQAVEKSNGAVAASAVRSGGRVADLRFACTRSGHVAVVRVASSGASFGDLRQAVRNAGYDRVAHKYLVFADMKSPYGGVAGMGQMFKDDRLSMDNANNGAVPMYAVVWKRWWSSSVPLHELTHTMGAVQPSAPSNHAGSHCKDSYDIMCYTHDGTSCGRYVFDCRNDTYFTTRPAPGSYLAMHWNLGWPGNRFIDVAGRPTPNTAPTAAIRSLQCTTWTCIADGRDSMDLDGRIVSVRWDWGDGTGTTGWRSRHHYTADGTYVVRLTVRDDRGRRAVTRQQVEVVNEAPTADIAASCDGRTCTFDGAGATDGDGRVNRWRWHVAGTGLIGRTVSHRFSGDGVHEVTLRVSDNDGHWSSIARRTVIVCGQTAAVDQLTCQVTGVATDPVVVTTQRVTDELSDVEVGVPAADEVVDDTVDGVTDVVHEFP